jgi:hypothetical protein
VVQQCRLFASVEYPGGQLGEVCFKSLVGCCVWVDHREITAKSGVGDGCFLVGLVNSQSIEPSRGGVERTRDLPTERVGGVTAFLSWCSSQMPVVSR